MDRFRVLPGLPGEGEPPVQFSATGQAMHREGFVVEFYPLKRERWIGNFQPGFGEINRVLLDPDGVHALVIAGGQGYRVNADSAELVATLPSDVMLVLEAPVVDGQILSNGIRFELYRNGAIAWRTRRLSWDGVRNLAVLDTTLHGEAWMFDESWHPFSVDLRDGEAVGGAYTEPEA